MPGLRAGHDYLCASQNVDGRASPAMTIVGGLEGALARRSAGRTRLGRNEAFALSLLAGELAGPANGLGLLASALLGRLFVVIAELHLAEDAFALHLFLQRPEGLIHIVIANDDLHARHSPIQRVEETKANPVRDQRFRIHDCSNKRAADCPAMPCHELFGRSLVVWPILRPGLASALPYRCT